MRDTCSKRGRPSSRVVVVGAGMGGLAAALLLAESGFDVTVLERADGPGGKLREISVAGRTIDAGPTVLTLPSAFAAILARVGERLADHVALVPADVLARHHWEDGSTLDLHADIERSAEAIGTFAGPREAAAYRAFCARAAEVYRTLEGPFIGSAEPGIGRLMRQGGIGGLPALARIRAFSTLWSVIGDYFRDARLRQLFARYATYCGSSPFAAPGPLILVAHVEQAGVFLVEGGMHRLAKAFERLAGARGAAFRYGQHVAEIMSSDGVVRGVRLDDGGEMPADIVVMNGDPGALGAGLFGDAVRRATTTWSPAERSLSALTLSMVAQARGFPLLRHTVFFSDDYEAEFDAIFRGGRLPDRPTVYVCAQDRSAVDNPAPADAERLFTIVNAPARADRAPPPAEEVHRCVQATIARLSRAGLDLEIAADGLQATTPADFHRLFPATGGALYGRASHGWAASFQRPTARTRIRGLYLAGGAVHPGPGLPMAALSGQHAAEAIIRDFASTATSRPAAMPGGISTR